MALNKNQNIYRNWKLAIVILLTIPALLLGSIYIQYGCYMVSPSIENISALQFIKLPYQYSLFNSNVNLPPIVTMIGIISINILNILFYILFLIHVLSAYKRLEKQVANIPLLFMEWFVILLIYIFIISPDNIFYYILFLLFLLCDLALILSYWIYNVKGK